MADIPSNGTRTHYERTGGNKPPLILCHGFTDNGLCWGHVIDALQKDYDLIVLDARGHGLSAAPETGYTRNDLAADVADVIRGLGLHRPGIMGHSMGAMTAALTAVRYPDLVGCLVLEDPPWREPEWTDEQHVAFAAYWRSQIARFRAASAEELMEERKREPGTHNWDESDWGTWAVAKKEVSPNVIHLLEVKPPTYRQIVPHIACPALLVTGDPAQGSVVSAECARQVTLLNPRIQVAHIVGAGHYIRRCDLAGFLGAVVPFLSKNLR